MITKYYAAPVPIVSSPESKPTLATFSDTPIETPNLISTFPYYMLLKAPTSVLDKLSSYPHKIPPEELTSVPYYEPRDYTSA